MFGISGELDARTITDYNRTVDSANKTANTLIKIIQTFNVQNREEEPDPLLKIVNGGEVDE